MLEQAGVGERGRGDLEIGHAERDEKIHGRLVPGRGEPDDVEFRAKRPDPLVGLLPELQPALQITVGFAERRRSRALQFFRRIDHIDGALLELDPVAARGLGLADHFQRQVNVAIVVDADLGNHRAPVESKQGHCVLVSDCAPDRIGRK